MIQAKYTDRQFALIEAMVQATTCTQAEAAEKIEICADLAVGMDIVDVVLCQNALLNIIRRKPE